MRETEFVNDEYYHIYNRGTEKRSIFLSNADFERFLESIYLFNDSCYTHSSHPIDRVSLLASSEVMAKDQNPWVKIIAYCLLPSHYHMMLQQVQDDGISRFLQKLNMGYSKYFNLRYDRTGTLYEGPFKALHVDSDSYFTHLPTYIHLNALDIIGIPWREGLVDDWALANEQLDNYRWSSHHSYMHREQYLPIVDEGICKKLYKDTEDYLSHLRNWSGRELSEHLANFSLQDVTW